MKLVNLMTLVVLTAFHAQFVQSQSDDNVLMSSSSVSSSDEPETTTTAKEKTLTFLKELRNLTREAGDFLKLRCEVSGTVPATKIQWLKNDGPLVEERNRIRIKTSLDGNVQWSLLKFKVLETLDTAFYECRASNDFDTIKSVGIVTVKLGKVNFASNQANFGRNGIDYDDNAGLLPETYSDPAFPGMNNIEFEGGQQPTNFGGNNWMDKHRAKGSQASNNNLGGLGGSMPNLKPNARAGNCQPYVGTVCAKYVGHDYVFISEGLTQQHIEQKLTAALTVITASPDMSESCSHYAIPSICLSTLPLCDRRTEKPRELCREECELLEDQLCRKELAIARQHALVGTQMVLPVCEDLAPVGSLGASSCVSIGIPQVNQNFNCVN